MNTLFMSDPHLGHENICNFRTQFNSSKEHDECLRDNYHSIVRPKDTVWFNGDVAFTPEALEDLKSWNGVKHLVLGNHDNAEFKSRGVSLKMLQEVFGENIHGFLRKYSWWLSHCPIHPDELRGRMNVHGHCIDLNTEILTTHGWKIRSELNNSDLIYSINPDNRLIEIKSISEIIDLNYTGTVYEFNTKSVNQRVTSNHIMVGLTGKLDNYSKLLAKDLFQRNTFKYILNSRLNSKGIELSNNLLELYIAINADGAINKSTNLIRFILHKDRKKDYIKNLLNTLNIKFKEYNHEDGINKKSSINFNLPEELFNWKLKGLDSKLLDCTKDQFQLILKAYYNTDGTNYGSYSTVYTSKKEECDLLSHLATINGYTSTTTIRYQHGFSKGISYEIYFRESSTSYTNRIKDSTIISEVINEPFWCIKTELQNFFIRRNGKTSLTGNCHGHLIDDPRYFNICMEHIDYTPISLESIRKEFESRASLIAALK